MAVLQQAKEGVRIFPNIHPSDLLWATGLNVVYLAVAGVLFSRVMNKAREKGLLTKFASQ